MKKIELEQEVYRLDSELEETKEHFKLRLEVLQEKFDKSQDQLSLANRLVSEVQGEACELISKSKVVCQERDMLRKEVKKWNKDFYALSETSIKAIKRLESISKERDLLRKTLKSVL